MQEFDLQQTTSEAYIANTQESTVTCYFDEENEFENLICSESLDQMSPEIWPDKVPGIREMIAKTTSLKDRESEKRREWQELTSEDMDLITTLGNMKPSEIIAKIDGFLNLAFELGIEEQKEMSRGRIIDVFSEYKQNSLKKEM